MGKVGVREERKERDEGVTMRRSEGKYGNAEEQDEAPGAAVYLWGEKCGAGRSAKMAACRRAIGPDPYTRPPQPAGMHEALDAEKTMSRTRALLADTEWAI